MRNKGFWRGAVFVLALEVLLAAIVFFGGLMPTTADATPSGLEKAIATNALYRGVARGARDLKNPLTVTDATLIQGMNTYKANCAACHGAPDLDASVYGRSFFPPAPQFTQHPSHRSEAEIYYITRHGIRMSGMAAWGSQMEDKQLWQVAAFLARLEKLPPAIDARWKTPKTD